MSLHVDWLKKSAIFAYNLNKLQRLEIRVNVQKEATTGLLIQITKRKASENADICFFYLMSSLSQVNPCIAEWTSYANSLGKKFVTLLCVYKYPLKGVHVTFNLLENVV